MNIKQFALKFTIS